MKRKLWSFSSQTEGQKQEGICSVCFQPRITANCPEHTCVDTHTHTHIHTHTLSHTHTQIIGSTWLCPLRAAHPPTPPCTISQTESPCADPVLCVGVSRPDSTSPPRNQGPGPWFSAQSFIWELIRNAKSQP